MQNENQPILVYTTLPSKEEAERVGGLLVESRLAACVNIFPAMTAIYDWQGKREKAEEAAMIIKTRTGLQEALLKRARELHPYDTPALLVLNVGGGDTDFFSWIAEQTGADNL
jgi:periplasmic divalent cation tolerance protein